MDPTAPVVLPRAGAVLPQASRRSAASRAAGLPRTSPVSPSPTGRGTYANFQHGRIYAVDRRARALWGPIWTKFRTDASSLGYPTTDVVSIGDNRGYTAWFERGFILYAPSPGAHVTWGPIAERYVANGYAEGFLKCPTSDVRNVGDGRGRYQVFEGGRIYAKDGIGGHEVPARSSTPSSPPPGAVRPVGSATPRARSPAGRAAPPTVRGRRPQWDTTTGRVTFEP